ncbi:MAG: GRP family sugar transporter [Candidatus Hodarchaeota archaeon]
MSEIFGLFGLGEVAALLGACLFGLANIIYRSQRAEADVTTITTYKTWGAAVFFLGLVILLSLIADVLSMSSSTFFLLSLSVIVGLAFGDLIYLKGQELAGVSRAFPVAMSFPLVTYILELIVFREPFQLNKGLGILIIILGVIFIGRSSIEADNPEEPDQKISLNPMSDKIGLLLAGLAALLWSVGALILKLGLEDSDPIVATFVRATVASVLLVPLFLFSYHKRGHSLPSRRATILILIAGFFGMTLGAFFYVVAVKFSGASTAAALSATSPVFTVPLAMIFLKEKANFIVILGTLLSVVGVVILIL